MEIGITHKVLTKKMFQREKGQTGRRKRSQCFCRRKGIEEKGRRGVDSLLNFLFLSNKNDILLNLHSSRLFSDSSSLNPFPEII